MSDWYLKQTIAAKLTQAQRAELKAKLSKERRAADDVEQFIQIADAYLLLARRIREPGSRAWDRSSAFALAKALGAIWPDQRLTPSLLGRLLHVVLPGRSESSARQFASYLIRRDTLLEDLAPAKKTRQIFPGKDGRDMIATYSAMLDVWLVDRAPRSLGRRGRPPKSSWTSAFLYNQLRKGGLRQEESFAAVADMRKITIRTVKRHWSKHKHQFESFGLKY